MLRIAQDELGDANAPRLANRRAKQSVGALASLRRHEIIRRFEESIVDFLGLHEVENIDRPRLLECRRSKVLLRHHNEAALLVLKALDEIFPRDRFAVADAYALEPHRRLVLRVQHPEVRTMIANGSVQLDGDVHEAEGERSFPEGSSHK